MKIQYRQVKETADISAGLNRRWRELVHLSFFAALTVIVLYFVVGLAVKLLVANISFEREAKMFESLQLSRVFEVKAPTEADAERLQRVKGLLGHLSQAEQVPPMPYEIVILEEEQANAFAFPGGTIGVTSGLLELLSDDMAIAFVIGHELGHFYHRDHLQSFGRAMGLGVLYSIIFGGNISGDALTPAIMGVVEGAHSREQEVKADEFSLRLLYERYGKVDGFDDLFTHLEEQQKSAEWLQIFATHPAPKDRIDRLRQYLTKLE